jgi:hypothetical protein
MKSTASIHSKILFEPLLFLFAPRPVTQTKRYTVNMRSDVVRKKRDVFFHDPHLSEFTFIPGNLNFFIFVIVESTVWFTIAVELTTTSPINRA